MYRSPNNGDVPCLAPGEIGIGTQPAAPYNPSGSKVIEIDYRAGAYLAALGAPKIEGLGVEQVKIASNAGGDRVTGVFANHGATSLASPQILFFALDSGGRPYDFGFDSSAADLAAGSSWSFNLSLPGPIDRYVLFPVYGQPARPF